ncbi:MAG: SDR family NAD(P)-dependent oxidoreductase, partial [bacterium]|nr:SDR family NAD(P)-dependent oxidoreductase [bacterium]
MMRLKDKLILVTGGNGLLGSAIIHKIKEEGGKVINADITAHTNDDLSDVQCDICNEESVNELITRIKKRYGKIDGLVNNAYPRTKDWGLK